MHEGWIAVKSQEDIDVLMHTFRHFHDSCIREMHFIGSNRVQQSLSMLVTDDAAVRIIFQSQFAENSAIELEFSQLRHLHFDLQELCDHMNYNAALFWKDGLLYWASHADWQADPAQPELTDGVWLSAKFLQWRHLENALDRD